MDRRPALLASPSLPRAEAAVALKFIPYADLAPLDPIVGAFVARDRARRVFETLYALDGAGVPQPRMV